MAVGDGGGCGRVRFGGGRGLRRLRLGEGVRVCWEQERNARTHSHPHTHSYPHTHTSSHTHTHPLSMKRTACSCRGRGGACCHPVTSLQKCNRRNPLLLARTRQPKRLVQARRRGPQRRCGLNHQTQRHRHLATRARNTQAQSVSAHKASPSASSPILITNHHPVTQQAE